MSSKAKILFVDDEENVRQSFCRAMRGDETITIETAPDGMVALKRIKTFHPDIVITDVNMPNMDGLTLLEKIRISHPDIFVVIVTGYGTIEGAVEAMKSGAYDYILKPFDVGVVRGIINKIIAHRDLVRGLDLPPEKERRKRDRFENVIGRDRKMFELYQEIADMARTNTTVLITGETGTGKELVAEAIHFRSGRSSGPLVRVNCAALSETLIKSELFGYEKGAFTGAMARKKGHFESADGGTIFLDEIGEIPAPTQASLLRVLEVGTFQRVGGTQTLKVDTRFICATNRDLCAAMKQGLFRKDLFYRINVVSLNIPPLRERRSDIPLLADHFLKKYCSEMKKNIPRISRATMNILVGYDWPGNVRELANIIEQAVVFCKGKEIVPGHIQGILKETSSSERFTVTFSSSSLPAAEATLIRKVLEETNWNLKEAAKELCIARGTLYSKMKRYDIRRPDMPALRARF